MKYIVVIYEVHQIHLTYYWVSAYMYDVVVSTWKYTVCSQHVTDWYMTIVPNALCMLQMLVHDDCTIFAQLHVTGLL